MTLIRIAILLLLIVVALLPVHTSGQGKLTSVTMQNTDMSSGPDMYRQYCASCHGADGRGSAKAAAALQKPIPDLTIIGQRSETRDVALYVQTLLRETSGSGHELTGMPDWQPRLLRVSGDRGELATLRRVNLSKYIASMQRK